jgi:hypothetical protein
VSETTSPRVESPAPPPRGEPLLTPMTEYRRPTSSTWQGWAFFGAFIMALLGFFQALAGLIALFDKSYFAVRANKLLVFTSYTTWGWVHLIAGVVAVAAGLGVVLTGRPWARYTAIVVAGLSAIVNLGFLSASPVWSSIVILLRARLGDRPVLSRRRTQQHLVRGSAPRTGDRPSVAPLTRRVRHCAHDRPKSATGSTAPAVRGCPAPARAAGPRRAR